MDKSLFFEDLNDQFGYYYRQGKILIERQSAFQNIRIVETGALGRVLQLDGITQVGEKGEAFYHEPLVHISMLAHPSPRRVLVIGGGDGGAVREVLRHPSVKKVTHVDIDREVIECCRQFLPSISKGCWDDPKTELITQDGHRYISEHPREFDVVIMDMTDPLGHSTALYTREFFRAVKRAFVDPRKGFFSLHSESPVTRPKAFSSIYQTLKKVFRQVVPFYLYIQMYGTLWSFSICSDTSAAARMKAGVFDRKITKRRISTKIITGKVIEAMRVEYPVYEAERKAKAKIITNADPRFEDEGSLVCHQAFK